MGPRLEEFTLSYEIYRNTSGSLQWQLQQYSTETTCNRLYFVSSQSIPKVTFSPKARNPPSLCRTEAPQKQRRSAGSYTRSHRSHVTMIVKEGRRILFKFCEIKKSHQVIEACTESWFMKQEFCADTFCSIITHMVNCLMEKPFNLELHEIQMKRILEIWAIKEPRRKSELTTTEATMYKLC